jgi:hydrogenase expression/formation protein HypE
LSKTLGIEGTAILATDRSAQLEGKIDNSLLKEAQGLFRSISVVNEAMVAFGTGFVTAMHDPTEGGVAGGIHELADASKVGFEVYEDKMKIAEATMRICKFFQIDPLQLIASGSLLISVDGNSAEEVVKALNRINVSATVIGEILASPEERRIKRVGGHTENLVRPESDHLWKALSK